MGKNLEKNPCQVAKSCVSHLALYPWQLCKGLTRALSDCVVGGKLSFVFRLAVVPNPPLGNLGRGTDAGVRAVQPGVCELGAER